MTLPTCRSSKRDEFEVNVMANKLGRLHNLLRESQEREKKVMKVLRDKSISVYEMELSESNFEFSEWMGKLKVFVKKYKGLPPSLEELKKLESGDGDGDANEDSNYQERATELASWLRDQHTAAQSCSLAPHQLASLENIGVAFPLSEEDVWHRSLYQFQLYSREYGDNPILVQSTNGDLVRSIMEGAMEGYTTNDKRKALQIWCQAQQDQYQQDGFKESMDRYTKLVNAGFTFDVFGNDNEWEEHVNLVHQFKTKFGHVHIPLYYTPPPNSTLEEEDSVSSKNTTAAKLQEFINKVSTLIKRDALSPKRLSNLKNLSLYMSMGGRVHDYHVEHCQLGRTEREEPQRTKRKFVALALIAEKGQGQEILRKPKIVRGSMDNWNFKLEKLVAFKNKHGSVINIPNDVKLQGWVFSIIRKLSINSIALKGKKMELIESHDGLKDFLLEKQNLEAALEYAKARKEENAAKGQKEEGGDDMEDLVEDVLLGNKEDHELNAFMENEKEPEL